MKRGIALALGSLVIITLIMVIVGCGKEPAITEVRFGSFSKAVDYAPYLVAKNKGWFDEALKKQGIATKYELFQSLAPINESFATKRVDVVFEAEPPAIVGKAAGIDIKIVALSCTLVQDIIVRSDTDIQSVSDLKGKKIAVLAGTGSHYGLLKILRAAGLSASDIEVVDMIPPDAKSAFATGRVDGWAVWPPWIEQEEIAGTGRVLPRGDAVIQSIMVVRYEFAQEHPEVLREIITVLQRTKKWVQENPAEAQQICAKELDLPLEVIQRAWPRHDWAAQINEEVISDIEAKAKFLEANDFIQNSVDVRNNLIDLSFSR